MMLFLACGAPAAYKTAPIENYTDDNGPGSVPPSWYDYDPAFRDWYEPWFVTFYKH
jgi:hypothetical protein